MKDFNGDGKQDWKDDTFVYESMQNDRKEEKNNVPHSSNKFYGVHVSGLGKIVLVALTIVCLYFLVNGAGEHIGTLLGFGFIAFLIAQWLDS